MKQDKMTGKTKKMMNFFNSDNSPKSSASVVDGKLILSYPNALRPVVWQMDLKDAKPSALEVHDDDKKWTLRLKTPKGETVDIAPFETREDAVTALMAASKALENAHGQIYSPANSNEGNNSATKQTTKKRKSIWLPAILSIAFIFLLLTIWNAMRLTPAGGMQGASVPVTTTDPNAAGVPISADDYLRQR